MSEVRHSSTPACIEPRPAAKLPAQPGTLRQVQVWLGPLGGSSRWLPFGCKATTARQIMFTAKMFLGLCNSLNAVRHNDGAPPAHLEALFLFAPVGRPHGASFFTVPGPRVHRSSPCLNAPSSFFDKAPPAGPRSDRGSSTCGRGSYRQGGVGALAIRRG